MGNSILSRASMIVIVISVLWMGTSFAEETRDPVQLIFDTDMGNDVDDALALGVIHALQDRNECRLLAVTITKDHAMCAPFVDAVNTFYGRGEIPIGKVRNGPTPEASRFLELVEREEEGGMRYPHDVRTGDEVEEATSLLRRVLANQVSDSVTIVQVGFSTNLARLLDSGPDAHSELKGHDLVKQKVSLLCVMAGSFARVDGKGGPEYNVAKDVPSARQLAQSWPTPVVYSGYEIGLAVRYPAVSIERDFNYVKHHPLAEAYQLYKATPHERPCWDLTSVLYAVRRHRGYFHESPRGHVTIDEKGFTRFEEADAGTHRYLRVSRNQVTRVQEALVYLASQPPRERPSR